MSKWSWFFGGIDPGKQGGMALIGPAGAQAWPMPETDMEVILLLETICLQIGHGIEPGGAAAIRFMLEKAQAFPRQGLSSTFKYGVHYGVLKAALLHNKISFDEVTSPTWMRALGLKTKGKKAVTRQRAQQLFPEVGKITDKTAEALLIAHYCRKQHGG